MSIIGFAHRIKLNVKYAIEWKALSNSFIITDSLTGAHVPLTHYSLRHTL